MPFGTYNFVLTSGQFGVNSNGKINQHQINNEVDLKFPSDYSITSFKWTSTNQFNPYEKVFYVNYFYCYNIVILVGYFILSCDS